MADREATVAEDSTVPNIGVPIGFPPGTQVADFVVDAPLGRGSSGEVLAVRDLALDRVVAMKVLRGAGGPAIARFVREARISARLDHPGVPPVHALEFLPDGGLIFTMRRLEGSTLGEALRRTIAGETPPVMAGINPLINLGLRLCETLERAHALGIVHRDVKPDNIMLGNHGEVALVDWGECRLLSEPDVGPAGSTIGTPAYMSPEQARGESADARSDVYALGATLWHALTRRHPTWDDDPERFWTKKRSGILDPLPSDDAARIPRLLLAILRRSLASDPAGRYQRAAEFAADLERFQAGLAVEAHRESAPERAWRWIRRHRRGLAGGAVMLAVCLVAAGLLYREHLRQYADWGPPILVEDFRDDGWRDRWRPEDPSGWSVVDGRLIANGEARSLLMLDRPLAGAIAIEYVGEMLPGHHPGDLSVIWSEDPDLAAGGFPASRVREYWVQAGAFDNYFCAIYRRPDSARLDQRPFRLQHGVRYRFRVELDGRRIGMWIDGRRVLDVEEQLPIATGRLCLYAYYPGKAFSELRVYQKLVPQLTPVLAIGDAFWTKGLPAEAAQAYSDVAVSHPGTRLGDEARYLQGLALRAAGQAEAGTAAWDLLPAGEHRDRVEAHHLDRLFEQGRQAELATAFTDIVTRRPALLRQLRTQWQAWAREAISHGWRMVDNGTNASLVDIRTAHFPDHPGSAHECGHLLLRMGRLEEVLRRFPDEVDPACQALRRLGRGEEMMRRFADARNHVTATLIELGRFPEALERRLDRVDRARLLLILGRTDEALAMKPPLVLPQIWAGRADDIDAHLVHENEVCTVLAAQGRWDEALAAPGNHDARTKLALLRGVVPPDHHGDSAFAPFVGWRLAKLAWRGDLDRVLLLADATDQRWPDTDLWLPRMVSAPLVRQDVAQLRARLVETMTIGGSIDGGRPRLLAAIALGELPPEAADRSHLAGEAAVWGSVGTALAAELAGDPARRRQAWQFYRDLPWHRRLVERYLPLLDLEGLAAWRAVAP